MGKECARTSAVMCSYIDWAGFLEERSGLPPQNIFVRVLRSASAPLSPLALLPLLLLWLPLPALTTPLDLVVRPAASYKAQREKYKYVSQCVFLYSERMG